MYGSENNFSFSFSAGFLIGFAGLIYTPMFIYFILLWAFLVYTTTPSWRDFIVSTFGFCTPLTYYLVYEFVFADLSSIRIDDFLNQVFVVRGDELTVVNYLFLFGLILILMASVFNLFITLGRSGVKARRLLVMIFMMLILGLISLFVNRFDFLATFLVVSIPSAIIIANFFQNIKKIWLAETMFLYLIVTMIWGYFS